MHTDLLLHPQWIIPVGAAHSVLDDHGLAVAGGRFQAILPTTQARIERRRRPLWM